MLRLIVTADDSLFNRLADQARVDDDSYQRAFDAMNGLEKALTDQPEMILLDMELRSSDTLLETLHCRPETSSIPLLALVNGGYLPFALRRLCTAVLDRRTYDEHDHP